MAPRLRLAVLWSSALRGGALRAASRRSVRRRLARSASTISEATGAVEYEVKRSRFVATAAPASDFDAAERFLAGARDPKVRHNCWAWVGTDSARQSDDGEPSGTAAAPIRSAIESAGLVDVVLVVSRYKPSTAPKLGAGGLIRAYGRAARDCLATASPADAAPPRPRVRATVPAAAYGPFRSVLGAWERRGVRLASEDYDETGAAVVEVDCEDEAAAAGFRSDALRAGVEADEPP